MSIQLMNFDPRAAALIKLLADALKGFHVGGGKKAARLVEFPVCSGKMRLAVNADRIAGISDDSEFHDKESVVYLGGTMGRYVVDLKYDEAVQRWRDALAAE